MSQTPQQKNINYGIINAENVRIGDDISITNNFFPDQKIDVLQVITQSTQKLIDKIHNTIGNKVHFERTELICELEKAIVDNSLTIVHGHAGMGKSGITKTFVEKSLSSLNRVFAFRGDELIDKNLDAALTTKIGTPIIADDLFSKTESSEIILIWVDSLEKLLESNQKEAFVDLLKLVSSNSHIRLVVTIRSYALAQLTFSFLQYQPEKIRIIEVTPLSVEEQKETLVHFPFLEPLFENTKIEDLMRTPFYLNEAVAFKNTSLYHKPQELDELTLKKHFWNGTIEGAKHSLSLDEQKQRGLTFLVIAVKRAKALTLMIRLDKPDYKSIETLKKDSIIVTDDDNEYFAPAHDIFEDWALSKFIQNTFIEQSDIKTFFNSIGSEFPIRRGFRLWLQEKLKTENPDINDFIHDSINTPSVEQHWKDEILVSTLQSDNGYDFLRANKKYLLDGDAKNFGRLITVFRTACKTPKIESNTNRFSSVNFVPKGQGWGFLIQFIYENRLILTNYYPSIIEFISDWENKIDNYFHIPLKIQSEARQAALLLLHILAVSQDEYSYSISLQNNKSVEQAIVIIFRLSTVAKEEVEKLIRDALVTKEGTRKKRDLYFKIIESTLSYYNAWQVHNIVPELVCEMALQVWKLKPKVEDEWRKNHSSLGRRKEFGLEDNHRPDYFPASAYQTPVYSLLTNQTLHGLGLVVDIINHATIHYISNQIKNREDPYRSSFNRNDDYTEVEIRLNNGKVVKQYGNYVLYQMYRSTGQATPSLLKSVLMALEKYLLELAASDDPKKHDYLKVYFDYLIESSVSIATTAVLVSVAIAYPESVGDKVFPLIGIKEIYSWDLSRMASERDSAFIGGGLKHYVKHYQKERVESNQLPHRKKAFENLVIDLAFNKPTHRDKIFEIIDGFYKNLDNSDSNWRLKLNKIDIRKWEATEKIIAGDKVGFIIEPKLDEDVKRDLEPFKREQERVADITQYSHWAFFNIFQEKDLANNTYNEWLKAYQASIKALNEGYYGFHAYHYPAAIAYVGIKYHLSKLTQKEKDWCVDIVLQLSETFLQKNQNDLSFLEEGNTHPNPIDEEPALKILPFLLTDDFSKAIHNQTVTMLFGGLSSWNCDDNLKLDFFASYQENLWKLAPSVAMSCWAGIFELAKIRKRKGEILNKPKQDYTEKEYQLVKDFEKEVKELKENVIKGINKSDFSDLSFDLYDNFLLMNTLMFTPFDTHIPVIEEFVRKYMNILFQATLSKKESYGTRRDKYQDVSKFTEFISYYVLNQPYEIAIRLFDKLLNISNGIDYKYYGDDTYRVIDESLMQIIIRVDENNKLTERFNHLWDYLESTEKTHYFGRLFLKLGWNQEAVNWNPLKGRKGFYYHTINNYGHAYIDTILEFLACIGTTELLPECIIPFAESIKKREKDKNELVTFNLYYAEKLIERMFCNYRTLIRGNRKILDSFIYFLDKMVLQGSSLAFYVRENLVALS
jgi:hypothetical protein